MIRALPDSVPGARDKWTLETVTRISLVTGVIGPDCHAVGNRILEIYFSQAGFKVVNLGVMVSQEEFVSAAVETASSAVFVSSLYGHAELDCRGMREKCIEAGIGDILLYIGGNLVVGAASPAEVEEKFKRMGFDRVFPAGGELWRALRCFRRDLGKRGLL